MKILKIAVAAAMGFPLLATPTMATTDGGAYLQHAVDCLGLVFSDLQAHATQCGPFTQPPFIIPTGGSGAAPATCQVGEIGLTVVARPLLVAGQLDPCQHSGCGSLLEPYPDDGIVPFMRRSFRDGPQGTIACR